MDTESDPKSILPDLPEPYDGRNSIHSVINDRTQTNSSQSSLMNNVPAIEIKTEVGELYEDGCNSEGMYPPEFLVPEITHNLGLGGRGPTLVQVMGSIPTDVIQSKETDFTSNQFTGPKTRTRSTGRARNKNSNSNSKTVEKFHKCRYCKLKFTAVKTLLNHEEKFHKKFGCSDCDRRYLTAGALNTHIRRCHIDTGHKTGRCSYCDSKFATSELKFTHEEETHQNFVCTEEKCDLKFYSSSELNEHISKVHKKSEDHKFTKTRKRKRSAVLNKYTCEICGKRFNWNSTLYRHKLGHMEHKPFPCNKIDCSETFTKKSILKTHLRRIHGEGEIVRPHECTDCGKKFGAKVQLVVHLRTHTGETPYKCEQSGCTRSFYSAHALEIHVKSAHTKGPSFPCTKSDCLEQFSSKPKLETHLRKIHGEGQIVRPYECSECQKKFIQKSQLKVHLRTHTGETPYKCELSGCSGRFYSEMARRLHVRRNHTLGVLHPCSDVDCNEEFSTKAKMETHRRRVHGEGQIVRRHECTECEKKFLQKQQLVIHLRTHTGETPYQCQVEWCTKRFYSEMAQRLHVKRKHSDGELMKPNHKKTVRKEL